MHGLKGIPGGTVYRKKLGRFRAISLRVAVTAAVMAGLAFPAMVLATPVAASADDSGPAACAAAEQALTAAQNAVNTDGTNLIAAQNLLAKMRQDLAKDEAAAAAAQKIIDNYNTLLKQENTAVSQLQGVLQDIGAGAVKAEVDASFSAFVAFAIERFRAALTTTLTSVSTITTLIAQGNWVQLETYTVTVRVEITTMTRTGAAMFAALETLDPLFEFTILVPLIVDLGYLLPDLAAVAYIGNELDNAQQAYHTASNEITDDDNLVDLDLQAINQQESVIQSIEDKDTADQSTQTSDMAQVNSACNPASQPLPSPAGGPAGGSQGVTWGDPHIITFDGATYNFQQAGEFILTKSTVDNFEIQVRQQPWDGTSCTVAENSAFAFDVNGETVSVYVENPGLQTVIGGHVVTLPDDTPYSLPDGGSVTNNSAAATETISWPNGTTAAVNYGGGFYLTLNLAVASSEKGHLVGLLGTDNGDVANDLVTSGGQVLPYPAIANDTSTLYGTFSNGWRLTQADSLFTYAAGQSTTTFDDSTFPCQIENLGSLSDAQLTSATATCTAAGVTREPFLDGCVLDVAATGTDSVAEADADAQSASLGTATCPAAGSNLIANGSFECPSIWQQNSVVEYDAGSTAITGWTVSSGSVDLVGSSYWTAQDGNQSIDLAGSSSGALSQTVLTTSGDKYTLSWYMAANLNCGQAIKTMNVSWNGASVATPTFDGTGHTSTSMGWTQGSIVVTATASTSTVTFADATPDDSQCGAALDDVSLVPVGS